MTLGEDEVIALLNQAKYLYLRQISEPQDNSLRLVVEEANADRGETLSTPNPAGPFTEYTPIEAVEGCRTVELRWRRYVAYLVTEEFVGSGGSYQDEVYTGNLLRVYTKSHFLDHLSRDTGYHTEAFLHYKLVCLNHLIDVASSSPPEVLVLSTRTKNVKSN